MNYLEHLTRDNLSVYFRRAISRRAGAAFAVVITLNLTAFAADSPRHRMPRQAFQGRIEQPVAVNRDDGAAAVDPNTAQGPGPGPIGPGPGCNLFPAPPSVGAAVGLSYFGPPPSTSNPSLVGPVQELKT